MKSVKKEKIAKQNVLLRRNPMKNARQNPRLQNALCGVLTRWLMISTCNSLKNSSSVGLGISRKPYLVIKHQLKLSP
jgi:hypothetical protein